ncbi:MAG TPA: hypothetical protein VKS79_00570 [Gemmataceae bacterium]|nr:hypothetical protein [Gemmataceae bacterium]
MSALNNVAWEILNATADDCENLEQIYRQVHPHLCERLSSAKEGVPSPNDETPMLATVADCIRELVENGLLEIVMDENGKSWQSRGDLSYVWRAWFRMTPKGANLWESLEPPTKSPNSKKHGH